MDLREELINIREEISQLEDKAANLPKVIKDKDIGSKIAILKKREKEIRSQLTQEQLYGFEIEANKRGLLSEEEQKKKLQKTLIISGSVAAIVFLALTTIIIIKKRKNK